MKPTKARTRQAVTKPKGPPSFPPALVDVEAELGPAREWAGRCYEIATACVEKGFVEGVAVYGHWIGKIHPRSHFRDRRGLPFVRHGWVHVQGNPNLIFDPTRWTFTAEDPFLYFGPNKDEYDEGGDTWRKALRPPCPRFDPEALRIYKLTTTVLAAEAWTHVEALLGPNYLIDLDGHEPGELTVDQLFWLANAPYATLQPHARAIYRAIENTVGHAAIPIDNYRRAERG
jgi:hypothetical protein